MTWSRHQKTRSASTPPLTASAAPGARRASCSSSTGRSSVFDGMHAKYEHDAADELALDERDRHLWVEPPQLRDERLAGRPAPEHHHAAHAASMH